MNEKIVNEKTGEVLDLSEVFEVPVEKRRIDELDTKVWFEMNAKLQQKKNKAREILSKKGVLEKKGHNKFSDYKYFTEAQYKEIANEIMVGAKLEIKAQLNEMYQFRAEGKFPVGRIARMAYQLLDTETGFYEETYIEGEGLDSGDKAGYKAYTGAVKYFLANTFLVPTGDDPENESPEVGDTSDKKKTTTTAKAVTEPKAKPELIEKVKTLYQTDKDRNEILKMAKISKLEDLTEKLAMYFINFKKKQAEQQTPQTEEDSE